MRKFCWLMVMILLTLQVPIVSAEESTPENIVSSAEVTLLNALGITEYNSMDEQAAAEPMTRAELLQIGVRLCGFADYNGANVNLPFFDVDDSHPLKGAITAAYQLGLLDSIRDGRLAPDEPATVAMAAEILVRLTGYSVQAERLGGLPKGYLAVAAQKGITKGIAVRNNGVTSRDDILKMICNAIEVNIQTQTVVGDRDTFTVETGKTLLTEYLHIVTGKGVITATSQTAVMGAENLNEGYVRIEEETFAVGASGAETFLGYEVIYYASNNTLDEKTLLFVTPSEHVSTLTLSGRDILNVNFDTIEYMIDGKKKTVYLEPSLCVIWNGKKCDYNAEDLKPHSGTLTLIDNGDGYDTAFVRDYAFYTVEGVDTDLETIRTKYTNQDILLRNYDYVICAEGEKIGLEQLQSGDVLSVLEDKNKTQLIIEVSRRTIDGTIEEIFVDEGLVYINGEGFYTSAAYETLQAAGRADELRAGWSGIFSLNVLNEIADARLSVADTVKYGYLMGINLTKGLSGILELKLFTSDGSAETFKAAENMRVRDGRGDLIVTKTNADKFALFTVRTADGKTQCDYQLVKYKLNEEEDVAEIQMSLCNYDPDSQSTIEELSPYGTGGFTLDYSAEGGSTGYFFVNIFDCKYSVDKNAPVFMIPEDKTDERAYSVKKREQIGAKAYYKVRLFDIDDFYEAGAVVIETSGANAPFPWEYLRVVVVDKSVWALSDDETVLRIYGYQAGKRVPLDAIDPNMVSRASLSINTVGVKLSDLKQGDVIACNVDNAGRITAFELLFSNDDRGQEFSEMSNGSLTKIKYTTPLYLGYGKILSASSDAIVFNARGTGEDMSWNRYMRWDGSARVLEYNSDANKITVSSISKVKKGDVAVVHVTGYTLRDIIIYK